MLKKGDTVYVTVANPKTRATGVVRVVEESQGLVFVWWTDGDKSWWRIDRLTKIESPC